MATIIHFSNTRFDPANVLTWPPQLIEDVLLADNAPWPEVTLPVAEGQAGRKTRRGGVA